MIPTPSNSRLRIATRQSPLALWQAQYVQDRLLSAHPDLKIELVGITTQADQLPDTPLPQIGNKGVFVKALEHSVLNAKTDIAVHSMKDIPMTLPDGLELSAVCQRATPWDALVSPRYTSLDQLPQGSLIGTASVRRSSQLLSHRPDLKIVSLRGNLQTRLAKLDHGDFDAIILAAAGLIRMGLQHHIRQIIPAKLMLPAIGQGAIGIECRQNDQAIQSLLHCIHHQPTATCVRAERAFGYQLQGSCQTPIAAYAKLANGQIYLRGLVASFDGQQVISSDGHGDCAHTLGTQLANALIQRGADEILSHHRI